MTDRARPWVVKEVCTFPAKWKVIPLHTYAESNATSEFYEKKKWAENEAKRRNAKHRKAFGFE